MELKLRQPEVAVEAVAVEAVADLFRPRMRACLACFACLLLPTCYHDCTAQNGA